MAVWTSYTSYSLYYDGCNMTAEETEFLLAVASYQKQFGRRYPTWLEVLNILRCLGYRKIAEPVPVGAPVPPATERAKSETKPGEPGAPATK